MNTNEQFNLNKCPICKNALKYHTETPIEVPPEAPLYNPINTFINNGLINLVIVRHNGLEEDDDLRNNGLEEDDNLRNNGLEDDNNLSNEDNIDYSFVIKKYSFVIKKYFFVIKKYSFVIKKSFIHMVVQIPIMLMLAHSLKDEFLSK